MMTNAKLSIAAALLLLGSVWAYVDSTSRGQRFTRGQLFLPNLDPDEVATIHIEDGEDKVTLQRTDDGFTIAENHDYPARNEAVNRLLRDLLAMGLEKEVGRGSRLATDLEIEPPTDSTTEIALSNRTGQEMLRFRLGKSADDGQGRYVQRLDQEDAPIYLTSGSAYLSTKVDSFIRKQILNISQSEVRRVEGHDFLLASADGVAAPVLVGVPAGKQEKSFETNKLKSILSNLSFERAHLADANEVQGVVFEQALVVDLADDTSYILDFGSDDDKDYLRIHGRHNVGRVEIALDESEEELEQKAEKMSRAEEVETFNDFHDSWIYEVSSFTGDKLKLRKSDLLEDAS